MTRNTARLASMVAVAVWGGPAFGQDGDAIAFEDDFDALDGNRWMVDGDAFVNGGLLHVASGRVESLAFVSPPYDIEMRVRAFSTFDCGKVGGYEMTWGLQVPWSSEVGEWKWRPKADGEGVFAWPHADSIHANTCGFGESTIVYFYEDGGLRYAVHGPFFVDEGFRRLRMTHDGVNLEVTVSDEVNPPYAAHLPWNCNGCDDVPDLADPLNVVFDVDVWNEPGSNWQASLDVDWVRGWYSPAPEGSDLPPGAGSAGGRANDRSAVQQGVPANDRAQEHAAEPAPF